MDSHLKENIERVQKTLDTCGNNFEWQKAILKSLQKTIDNKVAADKVALDYFMSQSVYGHKLKWTAAAHTNLLTTKEVL